MLRNKFLAVCLFAGVTTVLALRCEANASSDANPPSQGSVVITGKVPDEASRQIIVRRLKEIYGADAVTDKLEIGGVVAPPLWKETVDKVLSQNVKRVKEGQLKVSGTDIQIKGKVISEGEKKQVAQDIASVLDERYTVVNALSVSAPSAQAMIDDVLSNRVVEFQSGSAILTTNGQKILDEIVVVDKKLGMPKLLIVGHTDNFGAREQNLSLSQSRAAAVQTYLVQKGIVISSLAIKGVGPDEPVASNATEDGRARNRRIEFKLVQ